MWVGGAVGVEVLSWMYNKVLSGVDMILKGGGKG